MSAYIHQKYLGHGNDYVFATLVHANANHTGGRRRSLLGGAPITALLKQMCADDCFARPGADWVCTMNEHNYEEILGWTMEEVVARLTVKGAGGIRFSLDFKEADWKSCPGTSGQFSFDLSKKEGSLALRLEEDGVTMKTSICYSVSPGEQAFAVTPPSDESIVMLEGGNVSE